MTEKYLYFAKKTARALALTESNNAVQTYTLTTGLINPIPTGAASNNPLFANGAVTAELQNLHLTSSTAAFPNDPVLIGSVADDDDHILGSHYREAGLNVDDGKLIIDPRALTYDGTNLVTVKTVAQDPVYGVTNSSTKTENDITFTINVPMDAGDALLQKASQFKGIEMVDNDTADVYFEPHTNDGLGSADKVRLSYKAGNFKALCDSINAIVTDERDKASFIVVADTYRNIFLHNNITGVTAIDALTLDS